MSWPLELLDYWVNSVLTALVLAAMFTLGFIVQAAHSLVKRLLRK